MTDSYTPSKELTFYYVASSTSCITEAILNELELEGERIKLEIGTGPGKTQGEEYMKINPNGRVPTIVHEGSVIWESSAITIYLGQLFGTKRGLWPQLGPKHGEAMKWVTWASVSLHGAGNRIAELLPDGHAGGVEEGSFEYIDPKERTDDKLKHARARMDKLLTVLDGGLQGREYLLGDFTFVDLHIVMLLGWFQMMDVKLDAYSNISPWLGRCFERPAIKKVFS